jgi:hypothetical protein
MIDDDDDDGDMALTISNLPEINRFVERQGTISSV